MFIVFSLNALSTTAGNLKTVFLSKSLIRPVYFLTFLDAMVFAYALKLIANTGGSIYIIVFAIGRMFGVYLGSKIDAFLAFGNVEVEIYKHPEDGIILADQLREEGYSVTTYNGYGFNGKKRIVISVVIPRKKFSDLKKIVASDGKVNMAVKDIGKTYGKVGIISN